MINIIQLQPIHNLVFQIYLSMSKRKQKIDEPTQSHRFSEQSATSNQFSEMQEKQILNKPTLPTPTVETKLNKNFFQRTKTTIMMILGFLLVLGMGHFYVSMSVLLLMYGILNEISGIKRYEEKQNKIPVTPILTWFIFFTNIYYVLGKVLLSKMPIELLQHSYLFSLIKYHNFICFCLWVIAFITFVLSLTKGFMKYQFRVFGWTCITSILIIFPGGAMLMNIHQGLCWFLIPAFLVVSNDIFAYLVGYFAGQRKLIELSPKKTWQGYIGGALITFFFSLILSYIVTELPSLACPQSFIGLVPFNHPECTNFLLNRIPIDFKYFLIEPTLIQLHTLTLALFASLIGPFGGFFASGLKRAIKIKDFANLIPGHGGLTDRFDCQLMMAAFTYFYLHNIILEGHNDFSIFINDFAPLQQLELYKLLQSNLASQGLI